MIAKKSFHVQLKIFACFKVESLHNKSYLLYIALFIIYFNDIFDQLHININDDALLIRLNYHLFQSFIYIYLFRKCLQ
jgi:hypothetical protein